MKPIVTPLTPDQVVKWERARRKGRLRYVLGVGISGLFGFLIADFFQNVLLMIHSSASVFYQTSVPIISIFVVIRFLPGLFFGLYLWTRQENKYAVFKGLPAKEPNQNGWLGLAGFALLLVIAQIRLWAHDHTATVVAYNNSGLAKAKNGDADGAILDYNHALELDSKQAVIYNNRALAKEQKGDLDGAIADYNLAVTLGPKDSITYYNRGEVRAKKGDLNGAMADYNLAIDLDPKSVPTYVNRGVTREKMGDYDGAIIDFSRAVELNPKLALAYKYRSVTKGKKGDQAGADADMASARELDPNIDKK